MVYPSWQLSPTQLTDSWWNGGENWKRESERTHGLRWRQPNRESKSCTCKQSKTRDSSTSSHGQAGAQPSPGKQGCIKYDLGRHPEYPPFPFLLLSPVLLLCSGVGYSSGQLESAVLARILPDSCAPPVFSLLGWDEEQEKVLILCKHCSAIMKTAMCYQHLPAQNQNLAPYLQF